MTARLVLDCSVAVKWRLADEDHVHEANELLLDRDAGVIELCAPGHFSSEVLNAFLNAYRRGRITHAQATQSIRDVLTIRVDSYSTLPLSVRAFEIAEKHGRSAYDSLYVALAEKEGIDFWTGDERLLNALNSTFPFVRFIRDYAALR